MPQRKTILVVDDAEVIRTYLKNLLPMKGYDVLLAEDGLKAMELLNGGAHPDVVVLDVMMPGIDGIETLRKIKQLMPEVPVIMLSVVGKAGTVVDAMNLGAVDYINKPFEEEELEIALKKVLEIENLKGDRDELRDRLREHEARERTGFLWASEKMTRIKEILEQVSDADVTILIHGESGVGKEVVARTTHELSNRRENRFVKVNCAALPEELLESELFGYERGAFTGASSRKAGKFEVASGGTMFLDEIGEMSPKLQAKLLQVLQDGEFSRLGGDVDVHVDVRVLAATNRNLEDMVRKGGVPRGPLLPAERGERLDPAAARAPRGDPRPGRPLPAALRRQVRPRRGHDLGPADARLRRLLVARQRARAREHGEADRRPTERGCDR